MKSRFSVRFDLFPDRLEMRHNGIPFEVDGERDDVRGICGLVEGTKSKDLRQIGKFGIGFKSVYAYTKTPEIYSGDKTFCIENYVHPRLIHPREDVQNGETLFVIPFDNEKIQRETAFSEIKDRLGKLGLRTLLFLTNTEEISWGIDSTSGKYLKRSGMMRGVPDISLSYEDTGKTRNMERWLVFERPVNANGAGTLRVEVAYLLTKDSKTGRLEIAEATNTKLAAFFPTEKETHLKFLIQGPYRTTPARDNIYSNDWNRMLINETAQLVADTIPRMKEMGFLTINYLNALPIEKEEFSDEHNMFTPIYRRVKERLLSGEALLPVGGGIYASSSQALIARSKDLKDLLSPEQLRSLFKMKDAKWLEEGITIDKTPELRQYLMEELKVPEIDPEDFARELTKEFVEKQPDDWIVKFYHFLLGEESLWRKSYYGGSRDGVLRSKPIIRLEDSSHTNPFAADGKALAYLPSGSRSYFPTVKENLASDPYSKDFLQKLGLRPPDNVAAVVDVILPKYRDSNISVSESDNMEHVEFILDTIGSALKGERRTLLIEELTKTPFLKARNLANESAYKRPTEMYLGKIYTGNDVLETYFEGNDDIWFLYEGYKALVAEPSAFQHAGCSPRLRVLSREPNSYDGHVTIDDSYACHKRGLDGFDPDWEVDGLEQALKTITTQKAKIIWGVLKEHYKSISGIIESCTRQGYIGSTKVRVLSNMGRLLTSHQWVPDVEGEFHKPSDIALIELPEDFDKESLPARSIAERLGFRIDVEQQLLSHLPEDLRRIFPGLRSASGETIKKIEKLLLEGAETHEETGMAGIATKVKEALDAPSSIDANDENNAWTGTDPQEEERIRREFGERLLNRVKKIKVTRQKDITNSVKVVDMETGCREFLKEEYKGHCQVCNIRLDLGDNKTFFEVLHLVEKKDIPELYNMEFNVLCLCPNCHALMKYGGRELGNVFETAEKVIRRQIAPEPIRERSGDHYVVRIKMAGKDEEIFYTPIHMAKFAALFEEDRSQ